jgi:hypothetical protein
MDLHKAIMNIKITSADVGRAVDESINYDNDLEGRLAFAYKLGHRDARHAAAELVVIDKAINLTEIG